MSGALSLFDGFEGNSRFLIIQLGGGRPRALRPGRFAVSLSRGRTAPQKRGRRTRNAAVSIRDGVGVTLAPTLVTNVVSKRRLEQSTIWECCHVAQSGILGII